MTWGDFWATTGAAAALAAFVATAAAMYLQWRARSEPDVMVSLIRELATNPATGEQTLKLLISNGGDGTAFQIEVSGSGCSYHTLDNPDEIQLLHLPMLTPGSSHVWFVQTLETDTSEVKLTVHWTCPPTRLRRTASLSFQWNEVLLSPAFVSPRRRRF